MPLTLYYVKAYSHHYNQYARFLLTALDHEKAKWRIEEELGDRWKVNDPIVVCNTDKPQFMEL